MGFERFLLITDGGCRQRKRNHAAAAAILVEGEDIVETGAWYLGELTNNQAEYQGLIRGMAMASARGPGELICVSDSQLMVRQLNGDYKVRNAGLKALFDKVKEMESKFGIVLYLHERREHPMIQRVDALLNKVLDENIP